MSPINSPTYCNILDNFFSIGTRISNIDIGFLKPSHWSPYSSQGSFTMFFVSFQIQACTITSRWEMNAAPYSNLGCPGSWEDIQYSFKYCMSVIQSNGNVQVGFSLHAGGKVILIYKEWMCPYLVLTYCNWSMAMLYSRNTDYFLGTHPLSFPDLPLSGTCHFFFFLFSKIFHSDMW